MIQIEKLYEIYKSHPSVQTDTRLVKEGDIFFALRGPRFNGNEFSGQALEKGAAYVVVDEPGTPGTGDNILQVEDVLHSLQELAKYHRQQFRIPFIAITGSNGKTTTKELIHAVLSTRYQTYTTTGNLNNHIGIPLTLLKIKEDAEIAVIEMGANHQREIAGYCLYTLPTHGLITNAEKAHLEGFGGIEGVRKGKGELFDFLRENQGTAFVNWDLPYLREMSGGINKRVTYGTGDAGICGTIREAEPFVEVDIRRGPEFNGPIRSRMVGDYNLPNILAAVCVGHYFGIPGSGIRTAIENYSPSNSRSQLLDKGSNHFILDAYNANPTSMKAAIENFARLKKGPKILMLGGMAELGLDSLEEHRQLISLIGQYPWDGVALVGGDFLKIDSPYPQFENPGLAREWLDRQGLQGAYILVKGSRSMQMEKILV